MAIRISVYPPNSIMFWYSLISPSAETNNSANNWTMKKVTINPRRLIYTIAYETRKYERDNYLRDYELHQCRFRVTLIILARSERSSRRQVLFQK